MPFQSRRVPPPRMVNIPSCSSTAPMSTLSLSSVIYSYERNRRARDCKPSNLAAADVHDEQLRNLDLHHAVQTQLAGSDIAGRDPSSVRNRLRALIAKRRWRHKHRSACLESVGQL